MSRIVKSYHVHQDARLEKVINMEEEIDKDCPFSEGHDLSTFRTHDEAKEQKQNNHAKGVLSGCLLGGGRPRKRKPFQVRLADILVTVIMFEDSLEDVESRSKYWEFQACNRDRFNQRIKRIEESLAPILASEHRKKIFDQRFSQSESK